MLEYSELLPSQKHNKTENSCNNCNTITQ